MALDPALLDDLRRLVAALRQPEYIRDLAKAVPDQAVKDLVNDFRSYKVEPGPALPPVRVHGAGNVVDGDSKPTVGNGSGWANSPELRQPDGLRHIDAMLDEEDRQWRAQRIRELAGTAHSLALAKAAAEAEQKATQAEQQPKPKGGQK
jgi:hypothetical protein